MSSSGSRSTSWRVIVVFPAPEGEERTRRNPRRAIIVCRERSIVRCDGGRFTGRPPPWLEARARLGCQTENELGAPAISSIPERLTGHEPASARMGDEDERTLHCRHRRFDG